MTGYLLDTSVLIASLNQTLDRLPKRIRGVLAHPTFQPVVSVVSAWEISIKHALGKLALARPVPDMPLQIADLRIEVLPLSLDHALEVAYPEPATKDPFDRLLLAVCACEGLKLLTTDTRLAGHRLVW